MKLLKKSNKKKFIKNVKKYFEKFKVLIKENKSVLIMAIPFALMELFIFLIGINLGYINYRFYAPILFLISWLFLFVGISISFKKIIGKIIYLFFSILFSFLFLVNGVYFSMTKNFFDFNLLESASEGSPYIFDAIKNCNPIVYVSFILIIISIIYVMKKFPKINKNNYKLLGKACLIFLILHTITPFTLGRPSSDLKWSTWKNTRNIYIAYNDSNKAIKVSGLIEYSVRNFYITFLKPEEKLTDSDIEFLSSSYTEEKAINNNYTGKFKGKNLIIVQLEGMDNWIISNETTPNIYNMMMNGYNFTNHYSYYNGGGSTFNSEFAVNTGFITPLSYTKNAYSFNKNAFPSSLANKFKEQGYSVNAFHMNTGEYYSRTINYKNWGYDNYYGLIDIDNYTDQSYYLDRELLLNEKFNELLFPKEGNFVDYLITYSGHLPFTNTKGVCKMLYDEDIEKKKLENPEYEEAFVQMTEEECVKRQAKETDYMFELLINKLKEKELLDNTVLVVFSDHYLYTLEDQTILDRYKNTSNNLINNTPFFIWSSDIKKTSINKVTSQLNILPTILNLYGIEYNVTDYIEKDALDSKYEGIVFFSDYSWYDGNVYVENGEVTNGKNISEEALENKNNYISNVTNKNDLTLKYNYFKELKTK